MTPPKPQTANSSPPKPPVDDTMLKAALAYAAMGFSVFPLHTPVFVEGKPLSCSCMASDCPSKNNIGKHPRTQKGFKAATTNVEQITKWWQMWPAANIGIATGKTEAGKNLVVIDIDPKNDGTESWNAIIETHPKLPETAEAITGSGGSHIFFYSDVSVKNSASVIAKGVDVRGEGGYVAAAPSLHASGKRYAWELSSDIATTPIAPLPDWLLALAGPKSKNKQRSPISDDGNIIEGKRNETLFSIGRTMRAKNAEHSAILAALLAMNEDQCQPPLDPKEVETIARQVVTVPIGLSDEIKEKVRKAEDARAAQKQKADEAKAAAKAAAAKAKAEAMKVSVDESRRGLQLVSHEFFAGSEKMEDPEEVAAREAAALAAIESAARAEAGEDDTGVSGGNGYVPPPNFPPPGDTSEGVYYNLSRGDSVELATLILREIRGKSSEPLVYDRNEFWYYNQFTGIWSTIERTIFSKRISLYAGAMVNDKPLHLSGGAINEAIKLASDYSYQRDYFNNAPTGILFKNGFVVVKKGVVQLLPHSPEHRAIYRFEFDYDPSYMPSAWLGFLEQVFTLPTESTMPEEAKLAAAKDRAERIAFLQEHAGASLMGEATKYGVCAVLFGETASNGKSVYLEVIKSIFPVGSVISLSPHDWTNRFYLAELAGARLNVVDELPGKEIAESESFKSVVTGGHIMVARKNQRPFNLVPNSGHLFACNALPGTKDQTDGFWRRFTVIPFERKFEEKEREIGLADRLIATDLAGIAVWAIQGLARLQREGAYTSPESSAAAKTAWQLESDQVRQWMEECTLDDVELDTNGKPIHVSRTTSQGAYQSYAYWVKVTGHGIGLSRQKFSKRLVKCCESNLTGPTRLYHRRILGEWIGVPLEDIFRKTSTSGATASTSGPKYSGKQEHQHPQMDTT